MISYGRTYRVFGGLAVIASMLMVTATATAAGCSTDRASQSGAWHEWHGNRFDGVTKLESDMKVLNPAVDGGVSGSVTRSYVELYEVVCGDRYLYCYAHIGWERYPDGSMDTFTKWADSSGNSHTYSLCSTGTVGNIYTYKVNFDSSSSKLSFYRAGNQCGPTSASADWSPDSGTLGSRINDYASQMPGGYTSGYHESWSASQAYWSGGWHDFGGNQGSSGSDNWGEFWNNYDSSTYDSGWDEECPYD